MDSIGRYKQCYSKNWYETRKAARNAAKRKNKVAKYDKRLRHYECKICSGFHLTTKPLIEDPQ